MKKINWKWVVSPLIVIVILPNIFFIYKLYEFVNNLSAQLGVGMIWSVFIVATFIFSLFLISYIASLILILKGKPVGYLASGVTAVLLLVSLAIGLLTQGHNIGSSMNTILTFSMSLLMQIVLAVTSFFAYARAPKKENNLPKKQKILNAFYVVIVIVVVLYAIFLTLQSSFQTEPQLKKMDSAQNASQGESMISNEDFLSLKEGNLSKEEFIKKLVPLLKKIEKIPDTIVDDPNYKVVWADIVAEPSAVHFQYVVSGVDSTKAIKYFNDSLDSRKLDVCEEYNYVLKQGIDMKVSSFDETTGQTSTVALSAEACF